MSIFHSATMTCGKCGTQNEVERVASVNADRRPDLRVAILDGSFQATTCKKCGAQVRLPPHLTYLEIERNLWIAAEPATLLEQWPDAEVEVSKVYALAFGKNAPPSGQAFAAGLRTRLVFGWPAFREKLLCDEAGLDDVNLELLKMAIVGEVSGAPMADQTELRLTGADSENLELAWVVTLTEAVLSRLTVPRKAYDAIAAEPEAWELARAKFDDVFLVDMRRLIAGPDLAEAAD
jgi:hypothetical protein